MCQLEMTPEIHTYVPFYNELLLSTYKSRMAVFTGESTKYSLKASAASRYPGLDDCSELDLSPRMPNISNLVKT